MNANNKNIIKPDYWAASSQKLVVGIWRAKQKLVDQFNNVSELPKRLVQVALNEAESLAWETEYPQLVFPALAEEKIAAMSNWFGHGGTLHGEYALAV